MAFNERQIDLIRTQIAPGCTADELALFLEVCRSTGLNPLMRQIYAIKRKSGDDSRMTIQTGIDGYRLLAARTGALAGIDDAEFDTESGEHPTTARVVVYRLVAGQRMPFSATARWREYAALGRDGKPIALWAKMPWLMLGKCAEALALRRAFPAELSGVYTAEEMEQADNSAPTRYVESAATPQQRSPQPPAAPRATAPSAAAPAPRAPWKALSDRDVLTLLDGMEIRGRQASEAFLGAVREEMQQQGLAWTRDQVLAYLRASYSADDADDETSLGQPDDLAELETGAPGN